MPSTITVLRFIPRRCRRGRGDQHAGREVSPGPSGTSGSMRLVVARGDQDPVARLGGVDGRLDRGVLALDAVVGADPQHRARPPGAPKQAAERGSQDSPLDARLLDALELSSRRARPTRPAAMPTASGSSSNATPAISTSSPGSNPCASSAPITPMPAQPALEVGQRVLVVEVVAGHQPLDAAAADPEAALADPLAPGSRGRRRAGTRGARPAPRPPRRRRPARRARSARARPGPGAASSRRELVEPDARRPPR